MQSKFMMLDEKCNILMYINCLMNIINSGFDISNVDKLYVDVLMSGDDDMITNLEKYLSCKRKFDHIIDEVLGNINESC